MSVTGVSLNSSQVNWQNDFNQRRQDLDAIAQALQSGDLASAQKTYSDLQQLQQSLGSTSAKSSQSAISAIKTDIGDLGKALESGDLSAAKDAFSKLQKDMQNVHRGHRHRHAAKTQDASTEAIIQTLQDDGTNPAGSVSSANGSVDVSA
jgi:soluble cytochrome b562